MVVEIVAVGWVRVLTLTRDAKTPATAGVGAMSRASAGDRAGDGAVGGPIPPPAAPGSAARRGAMVARGLGILAGRSARRFPGAEKKLRGGARRVGRHAVRLHRWWRTPPD